MIFRLCCLYAVFLATLIFASLVRRPSECFQLPASAVIFSGSDFKEIFERKTVTAVAFEGVPLANRSASARGKVLETVVREIDMARNIGLAIPDPVPGPGPTRLNHRRVSATDYDWLRGGVRVECKSGQLAWENHRRGGRWHVAFKGVKLAFDGARVVPNFDELYLALYTPVGIYVYRHNLNLGVSTTGRITSVIGHQIRFYGPLGELDWRQALQVILRKLDSSKCEFVEHVHFKDDRVKTAAAQSPRTATDVYDGIPFAESSPAARGMGLEAVARKVDKILNPGLDYADATSGVGCDGRSCCRTSAPFDWLRGSDRVECKSAQLIWHKASQRWTATFQAIKLVPASSNDCAPFDELLLVLYTPRGVYAIRHDLRYGICRAGRLGLVRGCVVVCCGPPGESDWAEALDRILENFIANSCPVLAFVRWDGRTCKT